VVSPDANCPDFLQQSASFANAISQLEHVPEHDYLIDLLLSETVQSQAEIVVVLVDVGEQAKFHRRSFQPGL
jgi:hypothetical protein